MALGITGPAAPVDWAALTRYAVEVRGRAYAPYSGFPVGAAGLVDGTRVVLGVNVENASYGLSQCAESGLVSALHATGGGHLTAVVVVNAAGEPLAPCGRCRQLLWEHRGEGLDVLTADGPRDIAALLPGAFDATDLA